MFVHELTERTGRVAEEQGQHGQHGFGGGASNGSGSLEVDEHGDIISKMNEYVN